MRSLEGGLALHLNRWSRRPVTVRQRPRQIAHERVSDARLAHGIRHLLCATELFAGDAVAVAVEVG